MGICTLEDKKSIKYTYHIIKIWINNKINQFEQITKLKKHNQSNTQSKSINKTQSKTIIKDNQNSIKNNQQPQLINYKI